MTSHAPCLISASMAYDTIMAFNDSFRHHILPDKVHNLNVAFLVSTMRVEYGGCAGNIAYNLKLLGGNPRICASLGRDGKQYLSHLHRHNIDTSALIIREDAFTAQAFITTDAEDNQITAFHPGAMETVPPLVTQGVQLALVGPAAKDTMQQHLHKLHSQGIATLFDLGQAMPLFDGDALRMMINRATYLAANDYEAEIIMRRTGMSHADLAAQLQAFIITCGGKGSTIYTQHRQYSIAPVAVDSPADPTGCGDAYRAGLLYGISKGMDWHTTGQLASLLGAIKVRSHGTQNHSFTPESICADYQQAFGETLRL